MSNVPKHLIVKGGEWGVLIVSQVSKDINWYIYSINILKFTGGGPSVIYWVAPSVLQIISIHTSKFPCTLCM